MVSPVKKQELSTLANNKETYKYYTLAIQLVLVNVGLILGGYYLDLILNLSPLFILLATFLSMACTIWLLTQSLK